jgi:hypothetical protein
MLIKALLSFAIRLTSAQKALPKQKAWKQAICTSDHNSKKILCQQKDTCLTCISIQEQWAHTTPFPKKRIDLTHVLKRYGDKLKSIDTVKLLHFMSTARSFLPMPGF